MHRAERELPAWVPGDEFWNSGPLQPRASAGGGRTLRYLPPGAVRPRAGRRRARAATRRFTITSSPEHLALTQLGPTQRCATCHREHNEPASFLVNSSDSMCVDCHERLEARSSAQLHVEPVSGFSARASSGSSRRSCSSRRRSRRARAFEFEWKHEIAALDKAVEQSNLKFSHTQHLDPDRVLRRGRQSSRSTARTVIASSRTASTSSRSRWRIAAPTVTS